MVIHHIVIPLTVYALMICTVETSFQKDFFPRSIMLNANVFLRSMLQNANRLNNSEFGIIEVNCSSSRQSFGNGAEFIFNGQTIEHISFNNNKCYNSKIEECTTDNCQCFPSDNVYIYKFEHEFQYNELHVILGCQMRFCNNETGSITKAVISLKFNGKAWDFFEYDVKVFNQDKEDNSDQNGNNSSSADIFIWIPVMCGILLVISVIVIVITCRVFRNHANKKREKKKVEEIAMDKKRTKDTIFQDTSWNIYTDTEDVNLDNIHTSIQGAIVDTILDQKQAIKHRAVTAMYYAYPVYHSSLDDRRSPLAAIFKHLGDDDSDDSDEIDVLVQNVDQG